MAELNTSSGQTKTDGATPATRARPPAHWHLLCVVLVLLPLAGACLALHFCAARCRRDVALAYRRSQLCTARALARSMEAKLTGVSADLSWLARRLGDSEEDDASAGALEDFLNTHRDTLNNICLADKDGQIRLSARPSSTPGQLAPEHLQAVEMTDRPCVYRGVQSEADACVVEVMVPIHSGGRFAGVLWGRVELTRLWALCAAGGKPADPQAWLAWQDDAGRLQYQSGRAQADAHAASPIAAASRGWVLRQLQASKEATAHLHRTGGDADMLAFAPIRSCGPGCGLAVSAPAATVMAPLRATQRTLWVALGGLVLTLVGVGFLLRHYERSLTAVEAERACARQTQQMAEAMRISEEKLRVQYDGIPIPAFTWRWNGEDFILEDYNQAAAAITRGGVRRLLGQAAGAFFADEPELRRDLLTCLEQKASFQKEFLYRFRSTGEKRPLLVTYGFVPPDRVIVHAADISELHSAHRAIAESERQYRHLFEESLIANAIIDRDLKIVDTNRPFAEAIGCSRDEIIGQSFLKLVSPQDRPEVGPVLVRAFHGGKTKEVEVNFLGKPRPRTYQFVAGYAAVRKEGKVAAILVSGVDITERKRAEEALRESEERFRGLVSNIPGAVYRCRCDPNWTMLFISKTIEQISGYPAGDFLHNRVRSFNSVIHPDDREMVRDRIIEAINRDEPYVIEYRLVRPDGAICWVHERGRRVVQSETDILLDGAIFDITEQKAGEQALRESEQRFRMVFEHSSDGISIKELDPKTWRRKLLLCNDRYVEMAGRSREELMSDYGHRTLLMNRNTPEERAAFRRRLQEGFPTKGIDSWVRPDGKPNYHEWTRATIPFGDKLYLFGVDRDITERLQAADALAEAHRQLMAARETERKHLARELHDSISQGLVALKLSIQASGGEQQADLANRCGEIAGEVRGICHGLYPPTLESLGLVPAIEELIKPIKDGRVKVTFRHDRSLAEARFDDDDEIALFRIAQESLNNALRHSEADRIELSLTYKKPHLTLAATDNGIGFDPTVASTGLGLSSMRDRAQTAGGELRVSCTSGRTRIEARIPAEPR